MAAAPGPLILQATASHLADAARALIDHELSDTTPCVVTAQGTTCQQRSVETTLSGLTDPAVVGGSDPAGPMTGPLVVTGLYIGVVMIGGAWLGRRLLDRMTEKTFLRILEALLIIFGLQFVLWPSR